MNSSWFGTFSCAVKCIEEVMDTSFSLAFSTLGFFALQHRSARRGTAFNTFSKSLTWKPFGVLKEGKKLQSDDLEN